ncbi:MAG: class I SAM-dependent methyltransferase [Planctomycetaceae bacterium]
MTQNAPMQVNSPASASGDDVCPCCDVAVVDVVRWLSEITGRSLIDSARLLRAEASLIGHNVRDAARSFGLESHSWNDRLLEFYASTDAFLFETAAWNACQWKAKIRRTVCRMLSRHIPAGSRVLCFGDGMGFDSASVRRAGYETVCFELSGPCLKFAQRLFDSHKIDVTICTDTKPFADESFDAIVCLDVLEHVPDPPAVVSDFGRWLRPGGMLVAHAPFYHVDATRPTHLQSNKQFAGMVRQLYRNSGFHLQDVGGYLLDPVAFTRGEPASPPALGTRVKTGIGQGLAFGARFLPLVPGLVASVVARPNPDWVSGLDSLLQNPDQPAPLRAAS